MQPMVVNRSDDTFSDVKICKAYSGDLRSDCRSAREQALSALISQIDREHRGVLQAEVTGVRGQTTNRDSTPRECLFSYCSHAPPLRSRRYS